MRLSLNTYVYECARVPIQQALPKGIIDLHSKVIEFRPASLSGRKFHHNQGSRDSQSR